MTDQELLQAMQKMIEQSEIRMGQMMDQKLDQKLEPLKADIEEIKESLDVVRSCTNSLIEWSEKVSMAVHFPLPAIDD